MNARRALVIRRFQHLFEHLTARHQPNHPHPLVGEATYAHLANGTILVVGSGSSTRFCRWIAQVSSDRLPLLRSRQVPFGTVRQKPTSRYGQASPRSGPLSGIRKHPVRGKEGSVPIISGKKKSQFGKRSDNTSCPDRNLRQCIVIKIGPEKRVLRPSHFFKNRLKPMP